MGQITSKKLRKSAIGGPPGSYWTTEGLSPFLAPFDTGQGQAWFPERNCRAAGTCARGEPPPPAVPEFMAPIEGAEVWVDTPPQEHFKVGATDGYEYSSSNWYYPFRHKAMPDRGRAKNPPGGGAGMRRMMKRSLPDEGEGEGDDDHHAAVRPIGDGGTVGTYGAGAGANDGEKAMWIKVSESTNETVAASATASAAGFAIAAAVADKANREHSWARNLSAATTYDGLVDEHGRPWTIPYPASVFRAAHDMPAARRANLTHVFPDVWGWLRFYHPDTTQFWKVPDPADVHAQPVSVLASLMAAPAGQTTREAVISLPHDGARALARCTGMAFAEAQDRMRDEIDLLKILGHVEEEEEGEEEEGYYDDADADAAGGHRGRIAKLAAYSRAAGDLKDKLRKAAAKDLKRPKRPNRKHEDEMLHICDDIISAGVRNVRSSQEQQQPEVGATTATPGVEFAPEPRWVAPLGESVAALADHAAEEDFSRYVPDMDLVRTLNDDGSSSPSAVGLAGWSDPSLPAVLGPAALPPLVVAMNLLAVALHRGHAREYKRPTGAARRRGRGRLNRNIWGYRTWDDLRAEDKARARAREEAQTGSYKAQQPPLFPGPANEPVLVPETTFPIGGLGPYHYRWHRIRKARYNERWDLRQDWLKAQGRHTAFYEPVLSPADRPPWRPKDPR